jgi:hypothetical protein
LQQDIITDFLTEEFSIVILDTELDEINELVSNLKMHKDKVLYIGFGSENSSGDIFDFHLKKPFTTSKIESLLNIIVKANQFKN